MRKFCVHAVLDAPYHVLSFTVCCAACAWVAGSSSAVSASLVCDMGDTLTWHQGDYISVTVPVKGGTTNGTFVNNATETVLYQPSNPRIPPRNITLSSSAPATVQVPALQVTKLGPGFDVTAGATFTFYVTAGVVGEVPVTPLILVDELQSTDLKFVGPLPWREHPGPAPLLFPSHRCLCLLVLIPC